MHSPQTSSPAAAETDAERQGLQQALGEVAHDLNNLLGVISNHAQLLRLVADDRQKVLQSADRILDAALRGAALAERLHALRAAVRAR